MGLEEKRKQKHTAAKLQESKDQMEERSNKPKVLDYKV